MIKKDFSYGIIPFSLRENQWKVLLVRHVKGHWAFPKGHSELNETPLQSATRELKEETALEIISWISHKPYKEKYFFTFKGETIEKTVLYFPAIVEGEVFLHFEECDDFRWLFLKEAEKLATFSNTKRICRALERIAII